MADARDVLDEVKGVGAATRAAVLGRYPALEDLALADHDELTNIKGVGPATAQAIKQAVAEAMAASATTDLAADDETTPRSAVAVATSTAGSPASETRSTPAATGEPRTPPGGSSRGGAASPEAPSTELIRDDLRETIEAVRDAALAVSGVVVAAVMASREQFPHVADNLREAAGSASRTAGDVLALIRSRRGRT